MSTHERLAHWWNWFSSAFSAAASAVEYDPHEVNSRRIAAIEERLQALEQSGHGSTLDRGQA